MRLFLIIIAGFFFVHGASPAAAQGVYFRIDIAKEIAGKTFWAEAVPDRYYFGEDGVFLLQYALSRQDYAAGGVREGAWSIEGDRLCLSYPETGEKTCYQVNKDTQVQGPWGQFDDTYLVHGVDSRDEFYWDRWMHGNLILTPDAWRKVHENRNTGFSAEAYRAEITGKIMRLPLGNVFHHENGTAYWLPQSAVGAVARNPSSLDDADFVKGNNIYIGKWQINGDRHCWRHTRGPEQCSVVVDAQNGFVPQKGYFQIMDDHFIRLIKPEDLIGGR